MNWKQFWRAGAVFLLTNLIPLWAAFAPCIALAGAGKRGEKSCLRIVLDGEVAERQEWRKRIGEGWVFRLVPIGGTPAELGRTGSYLHASSFSGWDLVVDREQGGGYPDALLLATPPYGSLSERELGTTFGLRAQDAIAWTPRHFHFFTTLAQWTRARALYGEVMQSGGKDAQGRGAARELLAMSASGELGSGEFAVVDASLVEGVSDPPPYARQWALHLASVPHHLAPAEQLGGGAGAELGELKWIRFRAGLLLPATWKLPASLAASGTSCAE